jgi:predicted nucleotidyltransferase
MKQINSLNELVIPQKHKDFLAVFLKNVNSISNRGKIERLILFGSCARGDATEKSDIDLAALGAEVDDETLWELYDCVPEYTPGRYVENDIVVITNKLFDEHVNSFGMVQRYIAKDGVDLSELLR